MDMLEGCITKEWQVVTGMNKEKRKARKGEGEEGENVT